jgi:hypothetical protein
VEQKLQAAIDRLAPPVAEKTKPAVKKKVFGKSGAKKPAPTKVAKRKTSKDKDAEADVKDGKTASSDAKTLPPNQSIEEVLVFELPKEGGKSLKLELPADAFGEKGTLEFEIVRQPAVAAADRPGA